MSATKKALFGFFTFLQLALTFAYFIYVFTIMMRSIHMMAAQRPEELLAGYSPLFPVIVVFLIVGMLILYFSLMAAYIINAVNLKTLSEGERIMWIILFVLIGTFSYPVYFFIRILPQRNIPDGVIKQ